MSSPDQRSRSLLHVVGTRPNFVKAAPVIEALAGVEGLAQSLVHTGQHYDDVLSGSFFDELGLPDPDVNLGVGSGSHAVQTAEVMVRVEQVFEDVAPDRVFVYGDVNSTAAAALTAVKLHLPVAHVEAGLRSGDRSMPEEINRLVTDRIADVHFTTERDANENLAREGVDPAGIHFVGNVMIDALDRLRPAADSAAVRRRFALGEDRYIAVTLHRPRNVDDPDRLSSLLEALGHVQVAHDVRVVFPMHPRTAERVERFGLEEPAGAFTVIDPLGYLDFVGLMDGAAAVVTDSGGIQEETTVLGVPCLTVRPDTERPVTVREGTNRLFDGEPAGLADAVAERVSAGRDASRPELWDGRAAERIAGVVRDDLVGGR